MKGIVRRGDLEWRLDSGRCWYAFPVSASMESLEMDEVPSFGGAIVQYGDRVLVAAGRLDGVAAAVYEFAGDDRDIDSRLSLIWLGDEIHADAGHALEACMNWCRHN